MQATQASLTSWWHSYTWQLMPRPDRRLLVGLLLLHFVLGAWQVSRYSITYDEPGYFSYAIRWAKGNTDRVHPLDDSKSPVAVFSIVPSLFKKWIQDPVADPYGFSVLRAGRFFMYVYAGLAAFILSLWLFRLWGRKVWIIPWAFFLFDPMVFSYSMIVGSDVACMAFVLGTLYALWRYHLIGGWRYWLMFSVFLGLALLAKPSMVFLQPLCLLLLIPSTVFKHAAPGMRPPGWARGLVAVTGVLLVINAGYFFRQSFFAFRDAPAQSAFMQKAKTQWSFLQQVPVPLPYAYVAGFDLLQYHAELGGGPEEARTFLGVTILGSYHKSGPVWYYYLTTMLLKLPLLVWALLGAGVLIWMRRQDRWQYLWHHRFVWLPLVFLLAVFSLTNPFQIGHRHLLPAYPFLYLAFSWPLLQIWQQRTRLMKSLAMLQAVGFIMFWPNLMAYTNLLVQPKKMAWKYLSDSSIDYGQGQQFLQQFLQRNPEYKKAGTSPTAGKLAVELYQYAVPFNYYGYSWLKDHFEPTDVYMHSILLFDIKPEDLQQKGLLPPHGVKVP